MSAGLVAVTVTPGSTAPVLSVTVPLIRPRNSCAKVGAATASSVTHRQNTVSLFSLIYCSSNFKLGSNNNRKTKARSGKSITKRLDETVARRMVRPMAGHCKGREVVVPYEFLDQKRRGRTLFGARPGGGDWRARGAPSTSEVEADAEPYDARIEQRRDFLERRSGGVAERRHGAGVGQVERVEHQRQARVAAEPHALVEAHVEDLYRLAAVGGDGFDAHGARAVSGEGDAQRSSPVAAALHLP